MLASQVNVADEVAGGLTVKVTPTVLVVAPAVVIVIVPL